MLPFMTAACIHDDNANKPREPEMLLRKLNLTFALLLENPSVVTCGIQESERELWLTDKLIKAQDHIQEQNEEIRKLREQNALLWKKWDPNSNDTTAVARVKPIRLYNLDRATTRLPRGTKRQKVSEDSTASIQPTS